jgi:hypothetical protein
MADLYGTSALYLVKSIISTHCIHHPSGTHKCDACYVVCIIRLLCTCGQVRDCAACLVRMAKATGIAVVIIGHVTKSGDLAGPRTVEHMVSAADTTITAAAAAAALLVL